MVPPLASLLSVYLSQLVSLDPKRGHFRLIVAMLVINKDAPRFSLNGVENISKAEDNYKNILLPNLTCQKRLHLNPAFTRHLLLNLSSSPVPYMYFVK